MKHFKVVGLIFVAAIAQMALLGAGSASATTIEITKVTQNRAVTNTISQKPGTSAVISRTDGSLANTCTVFHTHGTTSSFTGAAAMADQTTTEFSSCARPVTVHKSGSLQFEWSGGTNGTVSSLGAEITVGSPFGTLNCKTGTGTDIGTVTGTESGNAEMHINAVLNCGFLVPSASWKGSTIVTIPHAFGISA
ncbi:MAG: hypothetical protein M3Y75_07560 [Actinomycetota bacterium]|nr:hypothetical protein [Actinomycetota bacterium]